MSTTVLDGGDMTQSEMRKHLDHIFSCIKGKYWQKSAEYSPTGDAFHNFKAAAKKQRCTPERALIGMAMKHAVSIDDIVADVSGIFPVIIPGDTMEKIDEKIFDLILYYMLLHAMLSQRLLNENVNIEQWSNHHFGA